MNREEVMKLTDEELRVKAAELMGWENIRVIWYTENELDGVYGNRPGFQLCPVPDYPNDIAAAWGLVEKMLERDEVEIRLAGGECEVSRWGALRNSCVGRQWKDGDSPKQAITRAFILAMDGES